MADGAADDIRGSVTAAGVGRGVTMGETAGVMCTGGGTCDDVLPVLVKALLGE